MKASFQEANAKLLTQAEAVCRHLLPLGARMGREYVCGSLQGERGKSLSVNLVTGVWKDFATGDSGSDLVSLWAAAREVSQTQARAECEDFLGIGNVTSLAIKAKEMAGDDWFKGRPPSYRWEYRDATGHLQFAVMRWDHPTLPKVKEIRPFRNMSAPGEPPRLTAGLPQDLARPLLFLEHLRDADTVVVVEGETCAMAAAAAGYVATTHAGGANALARTDFAPLRNKTVVVWRDNDRPGEQWQQKITDCLLTVGVRAVHHVAIPAGAPETWDAADAMPEERKSLIDAALAARPSAVPKRRLSPKRTRIALDLVKPAPKRVWLADQMIPTGSLTLIAAQGGVGKGTAMLRLAVEVAAFGAPCVHGSIFGHKVKRGGKVVALLAEDDDAEVLRRLQAMYPADELAPHLNDNLNIYTLTDFATEFDGEIPTMVEAHGRGLTMTDAFQQFFDDLAKEKDLALVIFDPLTPFTSVDLNTDSAGTAYIIGQLNRLAVRTGAAIVITHHMRKNNGKGFASRDEKRDAIRGQGPLVDGPRVVIAITEMPDSESRSAIADQIGLAPGETSGMIFELQVVKCNHEHDRTVHVLVRDPNRAGALAEYTASAKAAKASKTKQRLQDLVAGIARAACSDHPLEWNGLFRRRDELGSCHDVCRRTMDRYRAELHEQGKIVKVKGKRANNPLIDVTGGALHKGDRR